MQTVLQNLRYALRQIGKSPEFTLTAVISLALGMTAHASNPSAVSWVGDFAGERGKGTGTVPHFPKGRSLPPPRHRKYTLLNHALLQPRFE